MKIIVTIILIFVIADVLIVMYVLFRRFRKRLNKDIIEEVQSAWKKIIREPEDLNQAIMEADKLLDYALTRMGYRGSLGAKLKRSPTLFRSINDVWAAHKVRNDIAHKINYKVDEKTYKVTMLKFKQAFKDLKIFQ